MIAHFPWWRCLHCGCGEYEDHVFTGHMKGVPMVHCASCKALHSQPDPDSKRALRWQINELVEALSAAILEHDAGGITLATAREVRAVLASVGRSGNRRDRADGLGPKDEHAVANGETPTPSPAQPGDA
jgi:hypothetical protein